MITQYILFDKIQYFCMRNQICWLYSFIVLRADIALSLKLLYKNSPILTYKSYRSFNDSVYELIVLIISNIIYIQ